MDTDVAPFARTLQLYTVLKACVRRTPHNPVTVRAHLAGYFSIDPKDDRAIHSRARQVRRLIREVEGEVKLLPDVDHAIYLQWVKPAIGMFKTSNLDFNWEQDRSQVSEKDLVRLEFCIDSLKKHYTEATIEASKLAAIRGAIEELKGDVLTAGFDDDIRDALVDAFQALLQAIDEYSLRGVRRLEEGLAIAVGTVVIKFGQLRSPGTWETWSRYRDRFGSIVSDLFSLISGALKNKDTLIEGWKIVKGFLPGGQGDGTQ